MGAETWHVCTVHWKSSEWIERQLARLTQHLDGPFRTYAALDESCRSFAEHFDVVRLDEDRDHGSKLDRLAEIAANQGEGDDRLLFLDGDAFPVTSLRDALEPELEKASLIAIRRDENDGELHPHPSFCLTTLGFWTEIGGTWKRAPAGQVSRTGARAPGTELLRILRSRGTPWKPLLRSNRRDLHPVFFAIYGDLVYHHGAGFRAPVTHREIVEAAGSRRLRLGRWYDRSSLRRWLGPASDLVHPFRRIRREISRRNRHLSRSILASLDRDPRCYRYFLGDPEIPSPVRRVGLPEES